MKKCKDCNECKLLELFGKNKSEPDGLSFYCKKCKCVRDKEGYQKHKDKRKKKDLEYVKNNRETVKNCKRKEYLKHKEKYLNNSKNYYYKNRDRILIENKVKFQKNKHKYNEYAKKRKLYDVCYRIKCNLRSRLSTAIRNNQKKGSAIKDLGCSIEFLKKHLESQFQDGMTWENYGNYNGKWNIDHILPLSSFDLTDRKQLLKACHYMNLQPLWSIDNLKKSGKIVVKMW